jgi:S1-C subfamily serine protease
MYFRPLCISFIAAAALSGPVLAQEPDQPLDPDQSLRLYAVHIVRVPKENWTGYGIYLGNGLVLTAAHVAGNAFWHTIRVEIGGQELAASVIKEGRFSKFDSADVDLALVSIDDQQLPVSLRLRRMPICKNPPSPGEAVIDAIPEGIAPSHVISPARLPANLSPKFRTAIVDVATTGNSGSGVFDEDKKCLLGIISAKIQQSQTKLENGRLVQETHDVAKYFVPSPVIADFIPPEYRF